MNITVTIQDAKQAAQLRSYADQIGYLTPSAHWRPDPCVVFEFGTHGCLITYQSNRYPGEEWDYSWPDDKRDVILDIHDIIEEHERFVTQYDTGALK